MKGYQMTELVARRTELKKVNGDVFRLIDRTPDNCWIMAHWIRLQSLETVKDQVLAPGIYEQLSFYQLHKRNNDKWKVKMFNDEARARNWLLILP